MKHKSIAGGYIVCYYLWFYLLVSIMKGSASVVSNKTTSQKGENDC